MGTIRSSKSRKGLAGFPRGFRVLGRDDLGDVLAADERGRIWCFAHGTGDWESRTLAFADEAQLHEFVAFQHELVDPGDGETAAELAARAGRIEAFARKLRGAPFAREAARATLEALRDRRAELRWQNSKRGRSVGDRQELGRRCEALLQEAGAGTGWMVRAHAERAKALVVVGPLREPWTEERVAELLRPLTARHELVFHRLG